MDSSEHYTLSLHDALPISRQRAAAATRIGAGDARRARRARRPLPRARTGEAAARRGGAARDRKSTRLNSSHLVISYAVFCLKKKNVHWSSDRTTAMRIVNF